MTQEWGPSTWGKKLTGSPEWRLQIQNFELTLTVAGQIHRVAVGEESAYVVRRGFIWTDVSLYAGRAGGVKVDGLPNDHGAALVVALQAARIELQVREIVAFLQRSGKAIYDWHGQVHAEEVAAESERRWITSETQNSLEAIRPKVDVAALRAHLKKPDVRSRMGKQAETLETSLLLWDVMRPEYWQIVNTNHTERELVACKDLFDRVESKPLTEEQSRAVICFDNRVQVVASAGSGKTSTMVAKAAYAIHRGFVAPEQIVLLAFNKQAAAELKERAALSFERLGMEGINVEASTFHALGLRIIGKATGEKPDIPDWATDTAGGFRKLSELVEDLKDRSATFRAQWDLFRFVFNRDLPAFGSNGAPDAWDDQGNGRMLTANGERVRSQEEAAIANWLFLHGVEYVYEVSYKFNTADEDHRQYRPDFYYPSIDLYHEHFALNAQGKAPPDFGDYVAGVEWKRQLHRERETALIETQSHQIRSGAAFEHLAQELTSRGIELDFNPHRPIPSSGQKPMEDADLVGLVRTFISHAKSNCLTVPVMRQRLEGMPEDTFKHRHRMFLDIVAPVFDAWDAALAAEGGIDFEDMLNMAAEHLESGRYEAPYELVMADEFQDASRARARLCRALVQKPGRFLFAVGDDWQSINRFAGADVSVMTGFREWFGHGQVLKLEQTFRCPQALCDVSSAFVSKNPVQISKAVRSQTPASGPVLQAFQVDQKDKLADAIDRFLEKLCEGVRRGTVPPGRNGKVTVFVLGRYNADRQYVPARKARFERWLQVSFSTIHRSKGSEADYVILPEMLSVLRGRSFPNTRADDPVLALAMPAGDNFPLGEERRLFYVALTRARRSVIMFTARGQCSTFLRELESDGTVTITDTDGEAIREEGCPSCKQGVMVPRTGPYGEFESCSNFPACGHKRNRRSSPSATARDRIVEPTAPVRAPVGPASPAVAPRSPTVEAAKTRAATPTPIQPPPPPSASGGFLQSITEGLDRFNSSSSLWLATHRATTELESHVRTEKLVIESALKSAKARMKMQTRMDDPAFRAIYERVTQAVATTEDATPFPAKALPSFEGRSRHPDPEVERSVQSKVASLKADRAAFLSTAHAQLSREPALCPHFDDALSKLNGDHYWQSVDPQETLNRPR
jgi:DNA helicase-4